MLSARTILQGQVLEKIKEIPDETIDCIITSPPYWGLRDYGVAGQWGLEPDFKDYLEKMKLLMVELKRVLKKSGSCWINLGDTYAGGNAHSDWSNTTEAFDRKRKQLGRFKSISKRSIQDKSLHLIPFEFAINCRDAGWIIRNVIPWYKENSMPSSVKDRFANKWEPIFFMTKNQRYYFNLDNVRVKPKTETKPFNVRVRDGPKGKYGTLYQWTDTEIEEHNSKGQRKELDVPGQTPHGIHRRREQGLSDWEGYGDKQSSTLGANGKPKPTYAGFNERWKNKTKHYTDFQERVQELRDNGADHDNPLGNPNGKNPGDVFFINPHPFLEAHFATFPEELPLTILRAACPTGGFVLDPFFGSGTVGVVAEQLALNWIGIELKEEYIRIAKKRLEPYMMMRLA